MQVFFFFEFKSFGGGLLFRNDTVVLVPNLLLQGVITFMSPVEVFMTAIKFFDGQKVCLVALSFPSELLITFQGSKVKLQLRVLDLLTDFF